MKSKRILLTSNLYRPNIGGVENSLYHLAAAYAEEGARVDVVCSDINTVTDEILPAEEESSDNIRIYRYKARNPFLPGALASWLSARRLYRQLRKKYNYNLVLARSHFNVVACWFAGFHDVVYLLPEVVQSRNAKKHLQTESNVLQGLRPTLFRWYHSQLQRIAVKKAKTNVVFSKNMRQQVVSAYGLRRKIPIIKPGVDLARFHPVDAKRKQFLRSELHLPESCVLLLGIGRYVTSKGFDMAIRSLTELPDHYCLCLVGQGVDYAYYVQLVEVLELQNRVLIYPPTREPERYYQAADIFMMTSLYEPLGQTILEAQASGLPIVAFKPSDRVITATDEVTSDIFRTYCEDVSPHAVAKAVRLVNDRLRDKEVDVIKISQEAGKAFSWGTLCENLLKY